MTHNAIARQDSPSALRYAPVGAWNDLTVSGADGRQRTIEFTLPHTTSRAPVVDAIGKAVAAVHAPAGVEPNVAAGHAPTSAAGAEAPGAVSESQAVLAQAVALAPPAAALQWLDGFNFSVDSFATDTSSPASADRAVDGATTLADASGL